MTVAAEQKISSWGKNSQLQYLMIVAYHTPYLRVKDNPEPRRAQGTLNADKELGFVFLASVSLILGCVLHKGLKAVTGLAQRSWELIQTW